MHRQPNTRTVTSKDGTSIAYEQVGQGPAIILVDGAINHRGFQYMPRLAAVLSDRFTTIAYDRRGRNESGDTPPYAVEREVEDIEALIDVAGGSAFLYGVSSGAALALEAASRLPEKVMAVAMYEPPYSADERDDVPEGYMERIKDAIATGRRGDAVALFMSEGVGMPAEAVAPMRAEPWWPALEAVAHTLLYDHTIMGMDSDEDLLRAGRWASATMPVLVIDGAASPEWAGKAAQKLVDILPNAQRRTLEGQTHEVADEVIVPVLVEFFLGVPVEP